jgi:hypothetical protein
VTPSSGQPALLAISRPASSTTASGRDGTSRGPLSPDADQLVRRPSLRACICKPARTVGSTSTLGVIAMRDKESSAHTARGDRFATCAVVSSPPQARRTQYQGSDVYRFVWIPEAERGGSGDTTLCRCI